MGDYAGAISNAGTLAIGGENGVCLGSEGLGKGPVFAKDRRK